MGYTDDLVVFAEEEKSIRWLFERLERNLDRKRLGLNTEKMKMIRCGREGGRGRRVNWWKRKEIEKVGGGGILGIQI